VIDCNECGVLKLTFSGAPQELLEGSPYGFVTKYLLSPAELLLLLLFLFLFWFLSLLLALLALSVLLFLLLSLLLLMLLFVLFG
jgi:hypothetical protein